MYECEMRSVSSKCTVPTLIYPLMDNRDDVRELQIWVIGKEQLLADLITSYQNIWSRRQESVRALQERSAVDGLLGSRCLLEGCRYSMPLWSG